MAAPMIPPAHARRISSPRMAGRDARSCRSPAMPASAAISASIDGDRRAVLMDAPPPHEDPRPFVAVAEWLAGRRPVGARRSSPATSSGACCCSTISATSGCARRSTTAPEREARALRARRRPARPSPRASRRWPGLPAARARAVARRSCSCSPTGIARRSASTSTATAIARPGARCWRRSPPTASARSPCCATIMPRTSCWSTGRGGIAPFRPARFPGRAGRPSGLRPRLGAGGRAPRRHAGDRAGDDRPLYRRRPARAPASRRAYWALAAQRNTRILGVFTRLWKRDGKPHYTRVPAAHVGPARARPRASGAGAGPRLVRRQRARRQRAARLADGGMSRYRKPLALRPDPGAAVPDDGDGDGGRPRQAHAAADRDPAQAAGRGRRQGADRSCARPAARGGRRARRWSTSIISPTRSKRISRRVPKALRSRSPTSASCCSKPAAAWCRRCR